MVVVIVVVVGLAIPFEEESADLLVLDSKEIADPSAVEAVKKSHKIDQQQFQTFTKECLVDRRKPMVTQSTTIGWNYLLGQRQRRHIRRSSSWHQWKVMSSCSHDSTLAVKREMAIWKTSFSMRTKHGHQRSPMEEDYDLGPIVTSDMPGGPVFISD